MLLLLYFIYLVALFSSVNSLELYTELNVPRIKDYDYWQNFTFSENHSKRQPTQPPSEWTNLTIYPPYKIGYLMHYLKVQFTGYDKDGNITQGAYAAEIPYLSADYSRFRFDVSVTWWNTPWTLFVGFK